MTETQNKMLEAALKYTELGLSIIPVGKDKIPLISWKEYQSKKASEDVIRGWFKIFPDMNIGAVTGKISGIVVVDIEKGGDSSGYPPTVTAKTGGDGRHLVYKHPGFEVPNGTRVKELTDIRGDGGYIVVAPSVSSKGSYEWLTPFESMADLAEMPEIVKTISLKTESEKKWLAGKDGVSEGSRNDTAASLAGKILTSTDPKLWESIGWEQLKVWNNKNTKPLQERELRGVWESIKQQHADSGQEESKMSPVNELLDNVLNREGVVLFHDEQGDGHISLEIGGHQETRACKSKAIKKWLASEFYRTQKKAPNSENIRSVLSVIEGKACFEGQEIELQNRAAWHKGELWYDLTNKEWQAIRVSKDKWELVNKPPIIFTRQNHHKAQVMPIKDGDVTAFLKYVTISNPQHKLLFLVYLVSCFIPNFPHVMLVIFGAQGSAKSTLSRLVRTLIDPSQLAPASFPTSQKELIQTLAHHYFLFFDNVSHINEEQSDTLCRAVTGGGHSKRELFMDDDDIIYNFMRCIGLNGINLITTRPDLLERSLLVELERVSEENRRTESLLYEDFNKDLPLILGGVFNVLVKALNVFPTINIKKLPRMADWTMWGCAIAEALGYSKEEFLEAYHVNVIRQTEMLVNDNIVATAIITFMEDKEDWKDTPTELLQQLSNHAAFADIDTREKYWPKGAGALSRRLNELSTPLRQMGILVTIDTSGVERSIHLQKTALKKPEQGKMAVEVDIIDDTDDKKSIPRDPLPPEARPF